MRVLVTGASGFVASHLIPAIEARGLEVRAAARRAVPRRQSVLVPDVRDSTDWRTALAGCDAVVHLAARVHVMRDEAPDPLAAFRAVNAAGTQRLAEQAAEAGVRRFVFVSTVKVLGEASRPGHPFTDDAPTAPQDPYAISKAEAEEALAVIGARAGMRVAMLRPPLVYGPGVGANFLRLMVAVARGRPLPLGAVANRRSLVFVGNLVAAIAFCLEHEDARGAYLVADGEDLSTPELIRRMGMALGRSPRLVAVPPALLKAAGLLFGKRAEVDRLLGDLAVAPTRLAALGWRPPFTVDAGLAETAAWVRRHGGRAGGNAVESR